MAVFLLGSGRLGISRVLVAPCRSAARSFAQSGSPPPSLPPNSKNKAKLKGANGAESEAPNGTLGKEMHETARSSDSTPLASDEVNPPERESAHASSTSPSTPTLPDSLPLSMLPTLDFTSASDMPAEGQTGAKSAKESLSTIERRRRLYGRLGIAALGLGLVGAWVYQGREWQEGEKIPKVGPSASNIFVANF